MTNKTSIILADDHPILLKGVAELLEEMDLEVVGTATNGVDLVKKAQELNPELIMMDLEMPKLTGLEAAKEIRRLGLRAKMILLTFHRESYILDQAREIGFSGYLLKDFELGELEKAIEQVRSGGEYFELEINRAPGQATLSRAEIKIVRLIAQGLSTKDIADRLCVSIRTVEKHRSNMITKLKLEKRHNSLLLWAQKNQNIVF